MASEHYGPERFRCALAPGIIIIMIIILYYGGVIVIEQFVTGVGGSSYHGGSRRGNVYLCCQDLVSRVAHNKDQWYDVVCDIVVLSMVAYYGSHDGV